MDLLDAAIAGDDAVARVLGHDVTPGWVTSGRPSAPPGTPSPHPPGSSPWGARVFVSGEPPESVGWGGCKGPPEVVSSRSTTRSREPSRAGLATAGARDMVDGAFADEQVVRVIAHTSSGRNASDRVLEKAGFRHDGDDREDGEPVRRCALVRPPAQDERSTG
jgi:hypothetical protein